MKTKILNAKNKLLELGYLDNEYLEKYLEILEANLETAKSRKSTQAHHAIPVNEYWTSNEPYKRTEALKLARVDQANFKVNLVYKDHLLAYAYLTLCTNLDKTQQKYEAQETLRKQNSKIGADAQKLNRTKLANRCHIHKNGKYKHVSIKQLDKYLQDDWELGASGKPRYKTN